ncbi:hypothetical protein FACS1894184_16300 [Clostridia bacterium]|nr:hypothetical protein FACS1894184_16300 [Clostridia bacterium]
MTMNDEAKYNYIMIGDGDYRIKKFTPKAGMRIAPILISKLMPALTSMNKAHGDGDGLDALFDKLGEALDNLDSTETDVLHDICLQYCEKKLPAKYTACYDPSGAGFYPVPELEWDFPLALRLMVECIKWNFASFFDGSNSAFKGLIDGIGSLRLA